MHRQILPVFATFCQNGLSPRLCFAVQPNSRLRWLPIVSWLPTKWFEIAREWSRRKLIPINMASTFSKFVYHKSCVNLRFQNVYPPSRRPNSSLLFLKEKSTGYEGVSTNETDLFDRHDHIKGAKQGCILPHVFAALGVCRADTNSQDKVWGVFSQLDYLSFVYEIA